MKPLELTIYPFQNEQYPSGYRIERDGVITRHGAANRAESKHLTDAELAAEYWRHEGDYRMLTDGYRIDSFSMTDREQPPWATEELERDRVDALRRFATAPHYYEEQE